MMSKGRRSEFLPLALGLAALSMWLGAGCRDERRLNYMKMPVDELFSDPQVRQLVQRAIDGDIEEVRALVQAGADVNALGRGNVTPLIALLFQGGSKEGFQALLDLGADPNRVMGNGQSVMNQSVKIADSWWIETAIRHGGQVDLPNSGFPFEMADATPLFYAIGAHNAPAVRILVDHGANIEHLDRFGFTPLARALASRNYEASHFLIERGAKLTGRTGEEKTTILQYIRERNTESQRRRRGVIPGEAEWFDKILTLLESRGIDTSPPDGFE